MSINNNVLISIVRAIRNMRWRFSSGVTFKMARILWAIGILLWNHYLIINADAKVNSYFQNSYSESTRCWQCIFYQRIIELDQVNSVLHVKVEGDVEIKFDWVVWNENSTINGRPAAKCQVYWNKISFNLYFVRAFVRSSVLMLSSNHESSTVKY